MIGTFDQNLCIAAYQSVSLQNLDGHRQCTKNLGEPGKVRKMMPNVWQLRCIFTFINPVADFAHIVTEPLHGATLL